MKILVTTSTYPRWDGDTEPAFVHELNRRLAKHHEMITLAPFFPGAKQEEIMDGVTVVRYRYFFKPLETLCYQGGILPNIKKSKWKAILVPFLLLGLASAIVKAHKRYQPDLVHNHWIIPQGIVWAALSKLFFKKTPSIMTSHGGDLFSLNGSLFDKLKSFTLHQHNQICVVSNAMKDKALTLITDTKCIKICPMGVDLTNIFTPPAPNVEREGVIFVGRLVSKKGVKYLIEAIAKLIPYDPKIKLTIVGDGPDRETLEALVQNHKLKNAITFLGAKLQLEVRDLLRKHKVAIFPSVETESGDQEGLGLTIIEALGCGCQVLCSDLPAIKDITDQYNMLTLFEAANSESIFETFVQLSRQSNELNYDLARNSRVRQLYDWATTTDNYATLYEELTHRSCL